uniref:Uracil-DNA glycosylase n=1 Tax=Schistosoma haematobium TaxID=6185 RepID=A0A095AFS7_SCHHA
MLNTRTGEFLYQVDIPKMIRGRRLTCGKARKALPKRPVPEGESSESSEEIKSPRSSSFDSLVISRLEEKEELQHLNDRFANYIEHLHKNIFNKEFSGHIDLLTNSLKNEMDDYVKVFSNEVELLRQNLNKTSLELTNAKIQLKKSTSDLDETIKQLERSKANETEMGNKIASLNVQLSQLQNQLDVCNNYKTDYDSLMDQHKMLKSQLENETLLHTDTKNKLLTALEQLEFKNQLLAKERNIWNSESIQSHLTSIIKSVEANSHDKLCHLLSEIRSQMTIQYDQAKNKIKEGLKATLDAEKLRSNSLEQDLRNKITECRRLSQLVSSQSSDLYNCRHDLEATRKQLKDFEQQLKFNEDKLHGIISQHRSEVERLLELLTDKSTECTELAGIKIQLDAELAMYRKLLEGEESRLHLSPTEKILKGKPIVRTNITPTKRTYSDMYTSSLKSKQQSTGSCLHDVDLDHTDTNNIVQSYPLTTERKISEISDSHSKITNIDFNLHSSGLSTFPSSSSLIGDSLRITCRADGPIHFSSADPGEGLLRIYNASEDAIDLSNWHLYAGPTHEGSSDYIKLYTFHKSQTLQPHTELQVFLCFASEPSQVSSAKRVRPDVSAILHLITPVSVWNPYSSLIALQDSTGSVRATCEMESYSRKSDKISTSDVVAVDDEEDGSSDKVSSVCSDNDFTSNNDPQQQTVEDNNLNKSVVKITRLSEETTRTFQSHGEYFDLPKHVSSVRFRSDIWPNEASSSKLSQSSQRTLTSFFSRTSTTPTQGELKRKLSSSECEGGDSDPPSKLLFSDENKSPTTGTISPSTTNTPNMKPLSPMNNHSFSLIGNTKHLFKSTELDKSAVNKMLAECRRRLTNRSNKNVLNLIQGISNEWFAILLEQIEHDKFQQLADFIAKEQNSGVTIYPPIEQIFTWTKLCLPTDIHVVILGQDPYHGPRQAHGLAFSVCRPVPAPPSLINMYKEISSSMNLANSNDNWPPKHGDLTGWAKQGVLLLNAVLTVRSSTPNSHKDKGWEFLTDAAIRYLNKNRNNLVFMLWGASAQKQGQSVDRKRHLVLNAPHPSPLSASRGFFGCGHFEKANEYLKQHGIKPIDWTKLD